MYSYTTCLFVATASKMHSRILILLAVVVILYEANCSIYLHEGLTGSKISKRQTPEQFECIEDKIDAHFRGNTSSFVSKCKNAALQEVQIDFSSGGAIQQQLEPFFEAYCIPDCGNVINNAASQCGVYSSFFPGTEKLNVDMCGTNEDGIKCYQLYGNAFELIQTEASCYQGITSTGLCRCQSDLIIGVEEQGCCIDAYYDFLSGLSFTYSPRALYQECNVDFPTESCNNSPIQLSDSANSNFMTVAITVAAAIISITLTQN